MNSQKYKNEVYPEDFDEDEKLDFDLLLEQSKMMFPKIANEEWLIRSGIMAYMRKKKLGDVEPPTDEEIAKMRNAYINENSVYYYEEPKGQVETVEIEVKE